MFTLASKILNAGWSDPKRALERCKAGYDKRSVTWPQRLRLRTHNKRLKKLIIFITPGWNEPKGGVRSIVSIYEESKKLRHIHHAEALLCTLPGEELRLKYTWFRNHHYIHQLTDVLDYFASLEEVLIHIPEIYIDRFVTSARGELALRLNRIPQVRLNILLQNMEMIQDQNVDALKSLLPTTCTTAHRRYCNPSTRVSLGVPLHHLSVRGGAEQYRFVPYRKKQSLLVVSADEHPAKARILAQIAAAHPGLNVRVIRGMKYGDYLRLLRNAKWCLTFGEGLDYYFIETIFSGGISFAVYNELFFTPEFRQLETVYGSSDELESAICADLTRLDREEIFVPYQKRQLELVSSIYRHADYRENVREFYRGRYTYP